MDPVEKQRLLEAVKAAQLEWADTRDGADLKRQKIVRAALEAGLSGSEVAVVMGLTRARVFQIRDGTR